MHPSPERRRGGRATMPGRNAGQKPPNYGKRYPAVVLTREEIRALMKAFSRRGSAGMRNAAITALLYRSGLRINEALSAPLGDLDLDAGTFFVRFPKRDKMGRARPRTVGVDAETAALLERWLARRRALGINARAPLFCQVQEARRGQPMNATGYRDALQRAAARAEIDKRVHPHGLRHSFAFDWVQEARPLNHLQAALGHRYLSTTAHYADHLNPRDMLDAMRGRDWDTPAATATPELEAIVRATVAQLLAQGGG
jgi:site-specific recombinase XerD